MSNLFPESVSSKRKRLIRGLVQGHESAIQLKFLLQKPFGADGSLSAEELVANVLGSFTDTLSVLTSSEPGGDEVAPNLLNSGENESPVAASSNDRRAEDSSESRKISSPAPKDRRGCYKRRKTAQTRIIVSPTTDDIHAWRKYGQKEILNCKFPRSYFRCTRKYDQGCKATKQVQLIQENPDMYRTTYIGFHTCNGTLNLQTPELVTDTETWDSFLVNSHPDSKVPDEQDRPVSSQIPTIKQEYLNEDSDVTDNLDPSLWSDLKDFELSEPAMMPSKMASDDADTVYSCTGSQSLDMDFGVFSDHLGTDFPFD